MRPSEVRATRLALDLVGARCRGETADDLQVRLERILVELVVPGDPDATARNLGLLIAGLVRLTAAALDRWQRAPLFGPDRWLRQVGAQLMGAESKAER